MALQLPIDREKIAEFCRRNHIRKLSIFGSALRDDFGPESDVDVLVEFEADAQTGLFDMVRMKEELEQVFGRSVDVVSSRGVEASRNHIRRKAILDSAEVIHVAG